MQKLDLKKERRALFTAPLNRLVLIDVPAAFYLMADGHGDPNSAPAYALAVRSLYTAAYAIKFAAKAEGRDFVVMPLEGLWSARDPSSFTARRKAEWEWTMMIMVPDHVGEEAFRLGAAQAREKLGTLSESLRLEPLEEGLCLQALHVGSCDDEAPLLEQLHSRVMPAGGYEFAGRHHEIYLGDPRTVPPERLKTILRQPVRQA